MSEGRPIQDKVVDYLNGLSPAARSLLLRTLETKSDVASDREARLILDATRTVVHGTGAVMPDPATVKDSFFAPFAPFVIGEDLSPRQTGWVNAASLDRVWAYVTRTAMPELFRTWLNPHALRGYSSERELNENLGVLRDAVLGELMRQAAQARDDFKKMQRFVLAVGGEEVVKDLFDLMAIAERLPLLERLLMRLPAQVLPGDAAERLAIEQATAFVLTYPNEADYAAVACASRVATPATLARIALALSGDTDISAVRRSPGRVFVDVSLSIVQRSVTRYQGLRATADLPEQIAEIKRYHEAVRALTGVLEIEEDTVWFRRLSALRRTMSDFILKDLEGVVALIRAALTVTAEIRAGSAEASDAIRAVSLLMAVRKSKDAFALNEAVTRLTPVVERALEVQGARLIEQLRTSYGSLHENLFEATETLLRLCEITFGEEHTALVRKSRDIAASSRQKLPSFE
ncbi:hypothetical protein [Mongoliimonas terrestris]|uniref:hypothetical protein n=1 Tax=Mongoliimonas terrestris TaxID=1709001 RepID=UPI000949510F|nr:hypothetical protein [Mongoliimonas terrestris]